MNDFICKLRSQFPILKIKLNNCDLVYLDSAATSQKPQCVIDTICRFYSNQNASSHSINSLGANVTHMIESTRETVAKFIGCQSHEVVFTNGATEGINLVANGFLVANFKNNNNSKDNPFLLDANSEILIGVDQHHSNILPWQRLAKIFGCKVVFFNILASGKYDLDDLASKINAHTKIISISNVSNVLGVIQDWEAICLVLNKQLTQKPIVILDATQAVPHFEIDINKLGVDFVVFSGHKIYGPTGVGVLYGKFGLLDQLPNYKVGGDMVESVTLEQNVYKQTPYRFEAGTSNFSAIIGLKTAIEWFVKNKIDIFQTEKKLGNHLINELSKVPNITFLGIQTKTLNSFKPKSGYLSRIPLVSFSVKGVNSLDLALLLDQRGICIRSGQHCAGILHEFFDLYSTARVSLACFNTTEEIDILIKELKKAIDILQ